jgi:MSHA type pilus biogenesis protein MshL
VSGSDAPDFYGGLAEGVRALLSAEGRMNVDRTAGVLQVTDRVSRLDRIDQYIETVMLRVQRQVQIEAKVVEVELRDEFSAGINWRAVIGSLGDSATLSQTLVQPTPGGFTLALNSGDFSALLNAFAAQGKVNVLQSPRVTAMNNQPAVIRIGTQDVFFTTTTQIGEQGQILQTTVTPQSITEGVVLSVTPQISADGIIHMSINPTITERAGVATSRLGDQVPIVNVRETDSLVRVRQGETIVIAGMMQDSATADVSKVPLLGDVPFVGNLFRRTGTSRRKTDLVILLTPTIMGPGEVAANTARELQRMDDAKRAADKRR